VKGFSLVLVLVTCSYVFAADRPPKECESKIEAFSRHKSYDQINRDGSSTVYYYGVRLQYSCRSALPIAIDRNSEVDLGTMICKRISSYYNFKHGSVLEYSWPLGGPMEMAVLGKDGNIQSIRSSNVEAVVGDIVCYQ
jgi:hypothetical protein